MKIVPKTVRGYSEKLNEEQFFIMEEMMDKVLSPKRYFQERFSGIRSMVLVGNFIKVRNMVRAGQKKDCNDRTYSDVWGIKGRFWVQTLKSACTEINSMWSNLGNKLKSVVREYEHLSDEERAYCYYVLSARKIWQMILLEEDTAVIKTKKYRRLRSVLPPKRLDSIHRMIRRITRKYKPKKPVSQKLRCILYDEVMYRIFDGEGTSFIEIMTPGKGRLCLKLRGPWCYRKKGDIQVIFDRESRRVEIHKLIHVREKHLKDSSGETGVDKGLATLLSCSSGREYGEGFSTQVYDEAERINTRNTNRNYFIQKHKELRHEAESLRNDTSLDPGTKKFRTDCLKREMAHIEDHNLGSKRYRKQHACAMEEVCKAVNHAVKDMIRTEKPSILAKEDLTFTHDSKKKYAPVMRLLSQWSKGILDDRIEYKCMEHHAKTVDVNPSYTSQFCPKCGARTKRGGPHNSVMTCPDCGKMNANTAAAQNILSRLHDPDIEKHTPYKKVEKILIERYRKSHSV